MHSPAPTSRRLLGTEETAELLGLTIRQLRKLVREERIPHVRVPPGRMIRFEPDEIDAWIAANRRAAS
ncbi:MAG: helix-turn-helix domain-containing protein [Acidimicrobiaceae bacterium]|nr:helix-turn-helix domain-containing protein [Acidimicrobiaceae bacterium]